MAYKNSRRLKVYNQSGYRYNPTPTITLKGRTMSGGHRLCADRSEAETVVGGIEFPGRDADYRKM